MANVSELSHVKSSESSESAPVEEIHSSGKALSAPAAAAASPSKKSVKTAATAKTAEDPPAVQQEDPFVLAVGYRAGLKLEKPSHHCILIGANAGRSIVNGVGVVIISDTNFGTENMQSTFIVEQIDIPDWRVDSTITVFKQLNAALDKFEGKYIKQSRIRELHEYLAWQIESLSLRLNGLVEAEKAKADAAYIAETNKRIFK